MNFFSRFRKMSCILPNSQFESEPGYESIVTEVLRDFLQSLQENVMHTTNSQFESEPGYENIVTEVLRDFLQSLQENVMHTTQFPVRI